MRRRDFLAAAASAVALRGQSASSRMGAAKDFLCQGLELLSPNATAAQVNRAKGFFNRALDEYPNYGDAYYYKYVCLKHTGANHDAQNSALENARQNASEACLEQRDPFTLAVPKLDQTLKDVGDKWALVVGISHFQPDIGAEALPCPANDAASLAKALRDPQVGRFANDHVFELVDKAATTAGIKSKLNRIATKAKPEDVVLIYISTHGSSRDEDIRQVSYLFTYDTVISTRDDIFGTSLAMVDISQIVSTRCLAQRTVLILDTCHSGSAETISNEDAQRLREGAGRYILASCKPKQKSYENGAYGYFTQEILDVLQTSKGCVNIDELYKRVETQVSRKVKNQLGREQDPVIFKSPSAAEIVIGAPRRGDAPSCLS